MVLDNLGCVAILGGIVPAFTRGRRARGEYVAGCSPNPELQLLALTVHYMQDEGNFTLIPRLEPPS